MKFKIVPIGEQALNIVFPEKIDVRENQLIHNLAASLKQQSHLGIVDLIPAYHTLTVNFDVGLTDFEQLSRQLETFIRTEKTTEITAASQRVVEIPVCYGGQYGPDLIAVAKFAELTPQQVIALHCQQPYYVYFLGFLPGFAYAGFVPDKIAMPRLQQPRLKLAAGSVGIAGKQTGMYPVASPGGWQIIGQTPLKLYDPTNPLPPYHAGDWLQFKAITAADFDQIQQASIAGKYQVKTYRLSETKEAN